MTRAKANARIRGEILRSVRAFGVKGISIEGVEKIFRRAGRLGLATVLEEHLEYLVEKNYLRREMMTDELSGVERWMVWITPAGIDLLDEAIGEDPGVEIVC